MPNMYTVGSTHTTVVENETLIRVTYHQTDVVTVHRDMGIVILNHDGWKTVTTKNRMVQTANQFNLRFTVFQSSHDWFVGLPDGSEVIWNDWYNQFLLCLHDGYSEQFNGQSKWQRTIDRFKLEILPTVIQEYGSEDKIAIREAFNNWTDFLCKDGQISEALYNAIVLPRWRK